MMVLDSLRTLLNTFGMRRAAAMGVISLALIAGLVALSMRATSPNMGLLFTDLEPAQAQAITDKLKGMDVPFRLTPDGTGVMAPDSRLAELRMSLAAEQMTGQIGYELLDKQDALGTTAFLQNVNHVRAIEGELSRSIASLSAVSKARVHLSIPQRQLFDREQRKPSAAITLKTRGRLTAAQVDAIRNLVAASVADLEPGRISIVDQTGTLLAQSGNGDVASAATGLEERRVAMEARLRTDVETMLERIVGPGKVRAEIAATLDIETVRQEAEVFDPDSQVVLRSTTVESGQQNSDSENGGPVTVANNLPETQAETDAAGGVRSTSAANESSEQVDYQNSRTRTTTVRDAGAVKRLSVAVMVDGTYTTGADGKTTYAPRSAQELEKITRLVQNAIGYDAERGDSVVVENLQFVTDDMAGAEAGSSLPLGLEVSDVMTVAQTLVIGLIGLLAFFLIVRPMLRAARTGAVGDDNGGQMAPALGMPGGMPQLGSPEERLALAPPDNGQLTADLLERAAAGDEIALKQIQVVRETNNGILPIEAEIDVAQIEGRVKSNALKKVGEVVQRSPVESAAIVRQWMYS